MVAIVFLGLGLAVLLRGSAIYEVSSVIYVSPNFPATLHLDSETSYPYDSYVAQQVQAITNYDVLADAIRRAGSTDSPKIREALAATKDFPGVTGNISLDEQRNANKPGVIVTVENGHLKMVERVEP